MKRKRFTEEQVIKALHRHEAGAKVQDLCKELGIVEQTFYRWKGIVPDLHFVNIRGNSDRSNLSEE